jgi:hypothetical protein
LGWPKVSATALLVDQNTQGSVMQSTIDSQTARDELFKRIGRNVVNFQYFEATLRIMIPALYTHCRMRCCPNQGSRSRSI